MTHSWLCNCAENGCSGPPPSGGGRVYTAPVGSDWSRSLWREVGTPSEDGLEPERILFAGDGSQRASITVMDELAGGAMFVLGEQVEAQPAAPAERAPLQDRIDRAIGGLCPCGALPDPGFSPYCSYDCVPNIAGAHTSTAPAGAPLATPMRWRPDLVTAANDDYLVLQSRTQRGPYTRNVYRRTGTGRVHLRLDDGHRFVGCDVPLLEDLEEFRRACKRAWERLRRELVHPDRAEPESDPEETAWVRLWQQQVACRHQPATAPNLAPPPRRPRRLEPPRIF